MNEPFVTVVGNLAAPPTLRTLASGTPMASFRIAATPRRQDRTSGEWGNGETLWFGVATWRALAEHCADSLKKGDKVVVTGRLSVRSWIGEDEQERSSLEIDAQSVGLDLSRGSARMLKSTPPVVTEDAWASSGEVDRETGEVYGGPAPREPLTFEREPSAA